ncbi:MAG: sulfotransferase domain-containing protein [Actinomycetota bacterium]|nr:sulfotransferase domain-containing protein [Actinomycetota bacterium]
MADMLPNLLVVGVPKAGTSSLFFYLAQHPSICASDEKEIGYFTPLRNPSGKLLPVETYARHFAHCQGEHYRLEATPSYSYGGERVVAGIKDLLENPRIIVSLRDPVERLWSAYTMQRTKGKLDVSSSFDQYLTVCEERHRMGTATVVGGHYQGLSIGFYASYLGLWLGAFPKSVRVIFTEDFFSDPRSVVSDICRWLEIDTDVVSEFDHEARNTTRHAHSLAFSRFVWSAKERTDGLLHRAPVLRNAVRRAYLRTNTGRLDEKLDPSTAARLRQIYAASNREVAAMLRAHGYEQLPGWLQSAEQLAAG